MKPFYWILLALAGVVSCIALAASITSHNTPQSIYTVTSDTYLSTIDASLNAQNPAFSKENLSITDTQYVQDSIAVVKATTKSGSILTFTFEFYNNTLFLTNYTAGTFSDTDFNNQGIATYVINAAVQR